MASCSCSPWEPRAVGGKMRICRTEGQSRVGQRKSVAYGIAVQRDQDRLGRWEVVEKLGSWPAEKVSGGHRSERDAMTSANRHAIERCRSARGGMFR